MGRNRDAPGRGRVRFSRVTRLVCVFGLSAAVLLGAGAAAASPPAARQPVIRVFARATHGVVFQIKRGPDGRVWYVEPKADSLGAITDDGVATHYPTGSKNRMPNSLAVGKDKRVWFTLYGSQGLVGAM